MSDVWNTPENIRHTQRLLSSYRRWTGRELIERGGTPQEQARALFEASFVVVSHGTQADPILNYGNATALKLWEMDWPVLTRTPSRLTAEQLHRDERARLMKEALEKGYIGNYAGIRISKSGRRFRIEEAIVWNVMDENGTRCGQAATFARWTPIDPSE